MGKCSGLKGGGHHRRALDVAANKKAIKEQQRQEHLEASQRYTILKDLLRPPGGSTRSGNTNMDADIYLQVDKATIDDHPCLCREYFRYGDCDKHRRCKFSHQYTIADAVSNIMIDPTSITTTKTTAAANIVDGDEEAAAEDVATTIPALQLITGILYQFDAEQNTYKQRRKERYHNIVSSSSSSSTDNDDDDNTTTCTIDVFEMVAAGSNGVMDTIISYIESNVEVVALMKSCRSLNYSIGNCCPSYHYRLYQQQQKLLQYRNEALLQSKAMGGRLRYAVMYIPTPDTTTTTPNVDDHSSGNSTTNSTKCLDGLSSISVSRKQSRKEKRQNKKKKNNANDTPTPTISTTTTTRKGLRPILIYDYENPQVYTAYKYHRGLLQQPPSILTAPTIPT